MFSKSHSAMTLAFTCSVLLSGCDSVDNVKKAKTDPIPLHRALETQENVSVHALAPVDASDKITRLEQQVADLQKEVSAARPKIAKIDVMEQKFKDLSLGLDRIDATYNMKPAVIPMPVPATTPAVMPSPATLPVPEKTPEKPVEKPLVKTDVSPPKPPAEVKSIPKPPTTVTGGKVVKDLRIGEKKEFSRLVLDLGQPVQITHDIDNDEKILVIDIPGFKWEGAKAKSFPTSALIASYQVNEDEKGAHLVVQLKKAAKIVNSSDIAPENAKPARSVLDIAAQ